MKVGLLSDSHGSTQFVDELVAWFNKQGCDKIIHLGDDWEDVAKWIEIIKIPGLFSNLYSDPKVPNRLIFEFEGWNTLLTHTKETQENDLPTDLKPEEVIKNKEANVILYGHTHIPAIEKKDGIIYINPGHLKPMDKKGYPPTFAMMEFKQAALGVKIIDFKTKTPLFSKFFVQK
ncbi:MAG: YfcE family phosphodiesterase [Candidatus Stahlbacteria bacterium]|nr:YfcE family phosphodiesterase [Candidatus Stahlbacteria bacterium]